METAELVRGTQGAQATKAGSTGDGVPIMEGNSESDNEPGEQPRGVGSFYSLGSSLGRTGGGWGHRKGAARGQPQNRPVAGGGAAAQLTA